MTGLTIRSTTLASRQQGRDLIVTFLYIDEFYSSFTSLGVRPWP
jgi:hypothetical protein